MFKREILLKQHTPIIHFQHDQEGATLRATEVKPKLDRFIFNKFKDIFPEEVELHDATSIQPNLQAALFIQTAYTGRGRSRQVSRGQPFERQSEKGVA